MWIKLWSYCATNVIFQLWEYQTTKYFRLVKCFRTTDHHACHSRSYDRTGGSSAFFLSVVLSSAHRLIMLFFFNCSGAWNENRVKVTSNKQWRKGLIHNKFDTQPHTTQHLTKRWCLHFRINNFSSTQKSRKQFTMLVDGITHEVKIMRSSEKELGCMHVRYTCSMMCSMICSMISAYHVV